MSLELHEDSLENLGPVGQRVCRWLLLFVRVEVLEFDLKSVKTIGKSLVEIVRTYIILELFNPGPEMNEKLAIRTSSPKLTVV